MHVGRPRRSGGFSLIELLVAIVVIGVLAAIVTFAVRGAMGDAAESACADDGKVLRDSEEAYKAQHGRYATETELVSGGLIRSESILNNIVLTEDGEGVTVVTVAGCTGQAGPADLSSATLAPTTTSTSTTTASTTTSSTTSTTSPTTTTSSTTTTPTTTTLPPSTTSTSTTTSTTTVPAAFKLVFTVQPSATPQGATFGSSISVSVRDASNNVVTSSSVSVTLAIVTGTGSPAGRLTCTSNPKAAVTGVVTFNGCSLSKKANGYKLTATSPGLTNGTSATFDIT